MKAIFNFQNYLKNLILAALSFSKTDLESTEQVVGFGDIVETFSKNTLQKFGNT